MTHQWYDNFTIGVCLEVIRVLEPFSNNSVVIDLAVDGKGNSLIAVGEGLRSTVNAHNAESLMCQNCQKSVTNRYTL